MSVWKTPETLSELRKEAEEITQALTGATETETDVARVLELIRAAEAHLELIDDGHYPDEGNQVHLDLAAALAALAKGSPPPARRGPGGEQVGGLLERFTSARAGSS